MDSTSPVSSICLFKETRIDLQPLRPRSIIQLQVPSTSTFSVRSRQQRRILREPPTYHDEDEFNKHCLAASSSVFFGKGVKHPRSIIWRVLGDGKILELRSGDLSKSKVEEKEASLILQLCFPTALKYECVAIADTDDPNVLEVFALTKGNELYTLALRRDFFCYAAASEEDISRWCKASKPATFSISTPHRLIARNNLQLIISLSDGRLLMLRRQKGEDGSKWYESTYGDGQWTSSLRGLVRWQGSNTIKYEGSTLEQGTPTAMATAPVGNHIFAVCLNHTLRIWNPDKAVSVFSKDLLWQHREPHEIPKVMLDPASPNVLQLFQTDGEVEGDIYYAITFSPHDFGQFKFWGIRDLDHGSKGVRDACPDHILKPPDPDPSPESKAIWKVADFRVKGGQARKGMELWVLMRSNRRYKLYNLNFDIPDLGQVWPSEWSYVDFESLYDPPPPHVSDLDPLDATDKWLDFILSPGKTPHAVLATALAMYCSERSISLPSTQMSIKERMSTAIASNVGLLGSSGDFNDYRRATDQEWTLLWQEIRDLNKSRWSNMSLAYDEQLEMPWLSFADGCSTVRTCDKTEILTHNHIESVNEAMSLRETPSIETNTGGEPKLPDELALIIEAAATFRKRFSHGLLHKYTTILGEELWQEPCYSVPLRIQSFYDRCDFAEEIGTVPFEELNNALEPIGGFNGLQTVTFLAILEDFSYSLPDGPSGLSYTLLGRNVLVNGARELIHLRERMLLDLLALVIFVDMEIDRDEMPMEDFDAAQIYPKFLDLLRQYHIMRWLVSNERPEDQSGRTKPSDSLSTNGSMSGGTTSTIATIIDSLFARDLSAQSLATQSQSEALTYSIKDLLQWAVGGNDDISLDEMPVFIQTYLIANKNIDLASDFMQYQPSTAWSTYISGRLYLAKRKFTEAAIYFKKAAFKLSRPSDFDYHNASNSLLSSMEAVSFGNGLPTYYTHILNLFDSHSCPTQMAHFSHLALQLLPSTSASSDQSTTILTSLFQASLQITDFPTAYSALTRHPNPETLLPSFMTSLLKTPNALPQLLSLPFPPNLHAQIDEILSSAKIKSSPKILSAWRLHHNDYRGAAAALLPPLQTTQTKAKRSADSLENEYLAVINLLACAGEANGWVLSQDVSKGGAGGKAKRKVITIGDMRGQYQKELDRRSLIESGRYGFAGAMDEGDEMDIL